MPGKRATTAIGDSVQQTTGGLLVWRKADNWTAFTDGYRTWINGPNGLQQRLNTQRFEWEADYAPGGDIATPKATPAPASQPTPDTGPDRRPHPCSCLSRDAPFADWECSRLSGSFGQAPAPNSERWEIPHLAGHLRRPASRSMKRIVTRVRQRSHTCSSGRPQGLDLRTRAGGSSQSWATCMSGLSLGQAIQALYWQQTFGERGKPNPTQLEQWANANLARFLDGTLANWVSQQNSYRQYCAQFGAVPAPTSIPSPTPRPTPTPTPVPERFVDPLLEEAFRILRSTEFGEIMYQAYLGSKITYIAFAHLERHGAPDAEGIHEGSRNRILLDEILRDESHYVRVAVACT